MESYRRDRKRKDDGRGDQQRAEGGELDIGRILVEGDRWEFRCVSEQSQVGSFRDLSFYFFSYPFCGWETWDIRTLALLGFIYNGLLGFWVELNNSTQNP